MYWLYGSKIPSKVDIKFKVLELSRYAIWLPALCCPISLWEILKKMFSCVWIGLNLINQVQSNLDAASHEPSLTFLVKTALFKEIPGVEIIWMVAKTCDCETGDLHRICFGLSKFLFRQPVLKDPVWGNLLLEGPVFESDPLWQSPPIQQSGRPTLGTTAPEGQF